MLKQQTEQQILRSFFLFVNTGSGSNVGALLLEQEVEKIEFVLPAQIEGEPNIRCNVYIYNMRIKTNGFKRLKFQSQKDNVKCYAIVCGGDGTVMWVVTQLVKHNVKVVSVPIGIIPMGTGNDFAKELNWSLDSSDLLENGFKNLKIKIRQWIKAKEEYFDIWDVEAEVFEDGKFQKVQNNRNSIISGKSFKRTFCNYFSFGIDGKIGYSFDGHRQKSRFGNLVMYAFIGAMKALTKTKNLDELLESIEIKTNKVKKVEPRGSFINLDESSANKQGDLSSVREFIEEKYKFENNYYNILALNINSYTGGVNNIWQNAKPGFLKGSRTEHNDQISTGDGKLQLVSFGSSVGIAMERVMGGFSKKVAQGEGPFLFHFRQYNNLHKHRTYLQIDGQFIRFTNPKLIKITRSQLVEKSKIKILKNLRP